MLQPWPLISAAFLAACTASGPEPLPVPSSGPSTDPTALTTDPFATATDPASTSASAPGIPTPSASAKPGPPPHGGPLGAFLDGLRGLERKERKEHVRVLWLGDSHAQADFWPDAIRRGLQQRFGNGGPGFIHFGMKNYRHGGVKFDIQGGWRMRPKMPSTVQPWGDGAFGLGGILHAGFSGARSASVTLTDERLSARPLRLDLCFKQGLPDDAFTFEVTGRDPLELHPTQEWVGQLMHVEAAATGLVQVRSRIRAGRPDFCGLVIETDPASGPGVVLDTLGINGARYATALAWNEKAWAAEVARRPPQLFIVEYGGNEASDGVIKPAQYKQNALDLIARLRRAAPNASCLVIGPSDRADAEQRIPPIVEVLEQAAKEAKCQFWNTYTIMGGKGSLASWRDSGRAAPDGVHLKPNGYAEVGALLLQDIMAAYAK